MKKFKLNLKNLTTPLLALSLMVGCAGLFGSNVSAASVTLQGSPWSPFSTLNDTIWDSNLVGGNAGATAPRDPSYVDAGTDTTGGWTENSGLNDDSTGVDPLGGNFRSIQSELIVPACAINPMVRYTVGTIRVNSDNKAIGATPSEIAAIIVPLTRILPNNTMEDLNAGNGIFIHDTDDPGDNTPHDFGPFDSGSISVNPGDKILASVLSETWNSSTATIGDQMETFINDALLTLTYDNSSCPVVATDPDISTTPSSTPVTINILGNDTGTNLNVSKIDNQTIVPGDTITLTNGSGTVKLNTDGTITFTPNSTFSGESIFSYSITDGASTVDTGVVRITVAAATTTTTTTTNTTTTTTTTPSTPTASTTSNNSTKVLAKTGEDVRLIMMVSTTILILGLLAKFKSIKRANSYRA